MSEDADDTKFMRICSLCGHPGFAAGDAECAYCGASVEDDQRMEQGPWSEWGD